MVRSLFARFQAWLSLPAKQIEAAQSKSVHDTLLADFWPYGLIAAFFLTLGADFIASIPVVPRLWIATLLSFLILILHRFLSSTTNRGRVFLTIPVLYLLYLALAHGASVIDDASDSALANERRCEAIQKDMLSAHPRKANGPILFQALKCQPTGQGSVMVPATRTEYLRAHPRSGLPQAAQPSPASLPPPLPAPDQP